MISVRDVAYEHSNMDILKGTHKGIVLANNDETHRCAIKVKVAGILDGSTEALPWCRSYTAAFLGASPGSGAVAIPEVGSEVVVMFPFGDPHQPFYTGKWQETEVPEEFKINYPHRYGFKDSIGTLFVVDKKDNTLHLSLSNGFSLDVDGEGRYSIVTKKFSVKSEENADFETPELHTSHELSDGVRRISGDRAIFDGHTHKHAQPIIPPPIQKQGS